MLCVMTKKERSVTRQIGIELNINTDGLNELFQCPHIHVYLFIPQPGVASWSSGTCGNM